ncbi:prosaposin [Danio aesculapii]|uniref:prosaposin n=1 Tax=Danio aesculapii TaxID=1142201 RepID=UPI0024C02BB3|nr:prosaposin [Danio aesculapii]
MTKIALVFLLGSLLVCSGVSDVQMEILQQSDLLNPEQGLKFSDYDNKLLVFCNICKNVMRKVIIAVGKTVSKDEINRQLDKICMKLRIPGCRRFVQKYKNALINALLAGNRAQATCVQLKLCKNM